MQLNSLVAQFKLLNSLVAHILYEAAYSVHSSFLSLGLKQFIRV